MESSVVKPKDINVLPLMRERERERGEERNKGKTNERVLLGERQSDISSTPKNYIS